MPHSNRSFDDEEPLVGRPPADVDQSDRVLGVLTACQCLWMAGGGLVLWLTFTVGRAVVPLPLLLGACGLAGAAWTAIVLGRREGMTLIDWLAAAWRHARASRLRTAFGHRPMTGLLHPRLAAQMPAAAPLVLPGAAVDADGTIGLGADGTSAVASCSTVNFALRTRAEQRALVGAFGRWLNSLTGPVQLLVRAERLDLTEPAARLEQAAPTLPHPALEAAAREHAAYLAELSSRYELLHRRVLLAVREPAPGRGGRQRAGQRREEAARALAAADVTITALDGPDTEAALAACSTAAGTGTGVR